MSDTEVVVLACRLGLTDDVGVVGALAAQRQNSPPRGRRTNGGHQGKGNFLCSEAHPV